MTQTEQTHIDTIQIRVSATHALSVIPTATVDTAHAQSTDSATIGSIYHTLRGIIHE